MGQCISGFETDNETFYCTREQAHTGQHIAEDIEGLGCIGPASVPVTFTVLWTEDES